MAGGDGHRYRVRVGAGHRERRAAGGDEPAGDPGCPGLVGARRASPSNGRAALEFLDMRLATAEARESTLRRARLAEALTLAWMAVEFAVAIGAGVAARSVALTAFGFDSGIELFTA